jgi:putative component of membrane protein insertase Oxa1/YidC/SpoIIIJ protein YidD
VLFKKINLFPIPSAEKILDRLQTSKGKRWIKWKRIFFLIILFFIPAREGYGLEPCCVPSPPESSSLFSVGIEGYQKFLSPVLASQCYMLPSCSAYAKQALAEYGPVLGLLLIIDRLFREANEDQTSPLVRQGDQFKLYDPPSTNVWWKK